MERTRKLKAAILGSGNIGTDLLIKILRSRWLECPLFIGRNLNSAGLAKASSLGVRISDRGIQALIDEPGCCDLVIDATSALDHLRHWPILQKLGKTVIDMTPAKVGSMCVPAVNLEECLSQGNINMVTCGGQASIPIAYALGRAHDGNLDYVEIVSSIASRSAGPATRLNIDEYVETTEAALRQFSGSPRSKAILVLNPAVPCVNMQTTVFAKTAKPDMRRAKAEVEAIVKRIQSYVPGYQLLVGPLYENNRIVVMIRVQGLGDYLPKYSGNLDIINCAAIAVAEALAAHRKAPPSQAQDGFRSPKRAPVPKEAKRS